MARYLSLPITGNPAQALLQVQTRLGAVFGRRRVNLEYVHDDVGALTELIVVLADDLPEEDVRAFRRALENLKGTVGAAVEVPVGSGGAVAATGATEFPTTDLVGFITVGNVAISGALVSGPTTIHTDGGTGLAHDLSTTPITVGLPIQPGTLVLSGTIGAATETATDDGAGAFPTSTLLPSGGTIDYTTGAMTGTTAAIDASSTITETHTTDVSLSAPLAVQIASGAAAGEASLGVAPTKAVGVSTASLEWSFNVNFAPDFGLNNNAVSGAQALTLEARLLGLASGLDVVLQWTAASDDTTPPAAWDTPTFSETKPATAPTAALAVDMDAAYHELVFRQAGPKTLGVSYDGVEELFVFTQDIVVPSKVELSHVWGAALDRYFLVDDWSFSYALGSPA